MIANRERMISLKTVEKESRLPEKTPSMLSSWTALVFQAMPRASFMARRIEAAEPNKRPENPIVSRRRLIAVPDMIEPKK